MGKKTERERGKARDRAINWTLLLIFIIGVMVILYPTISNYINSKNQSRAIVHYDDTVSKLTKDQNDAIIAEADNYNRLMRENGYSIYKPGPAEEYRQILDITGTGIMGYISISKIHVELPIYHGTSSSVLSDAAGHLEGTSFPVGGEGTHSVISAHRGLPSAKLFTNLDRLEVGDTFTITVLGNMLTYEVDRIRIILPGELDELKIIDGRDYCTLMTCTPYGVNSHRLLVRGVRTANAKTELKVTSEAVVIDPLVVAPIIAAPILLVLTILVCFDTRRKKKVGKKHAGE